MSKIFINLLFLEGGTNIIFLAGSKALLLSLGGCIPKAAIFNSCSRTTASFLASAFNSWLLLLILTHAIRELPLTQPVLTLQLFRKLLSQHHELFELQLLLLHELFELLHVLITVLHAQILVLASKLLQFLPLAFPPPHRLCHFRRNGP